MSWALGFLSVVMILWDHVWRGRIIALEAKVSRLRVQVAILEDPEYQAAVHNNRALQKQHRDRIIMCRKDGRLDFANKLSELEHWIDRGYEAEWLDGMFRGFP